MNKASGPYIGPRGGKWADPQHTIPYNETKHAGKPAPKSAEHDKHGAREIELMADNDQGHYNQKQSIQANLAKKIAAGKYDHAQASKLFGYLADSVSKKYQKDHGSGSGAHAFDSATRRAAARSMADQFHEEVKDGEHDHHVSSGIHAKRAKAGGGLAAMARAHGQIGANFGNVGDITMQRTRGRGQIGRNFGNVGDITAKKSVAANMAYSPDVLAFYSK
jgi:hypothetical protein